ncbi:MAG TPA: heme exporter protein CcmB [Acidimicrobiales bacterium]|nr:heme exporter protein CcmB [Acidimicrobiales bacterium]HLN43301.1 heme exporter protein CcmB [Acidimicrobiales bacterium]
MWRDTVLVAGKDLRIELRSRVVMHQVVPVGVLVLVLFAFALGPDRAPMAKAAPGLFWVAVLFASVLAVQRSFAVEASDGARDGLRLSGLDPAGVFLGKSAAVAVQLVVLEVVLTAGVVVLYGSHIRSYGSIIVAGLAGTAGLAAAGTLYGALAAGLRVRETLLPFLFLPVAAPVLLAGTRAWQVALGTAGNVGNVGSAGDPWVRLLLVFAAVYLALGVVIFGPLQEAS